MVWPAVLLVLLLVPGRGEAHRISSCDELTVSLLAAGAIPEDLLTLYGFFVDPTKQTRVFLRVRPDEGGTLKCFLQHEDGPLSQAGAGGAIRRVSSGAAAIPSPAETMPFPPSLSAGRALSPIWNIGRSSRTPSR